MTWWRILKIRDPSGNMLRMVDYHQFVQRLKQKIEEKALPYDLDSYHLDPQGRRRHLKDDPRKSNININRTKGVTVGPMLTFKISGLNASSGDRYQYEFTCMEQEGDYVYIKVEGPGINYTKESVVDDEETLIEEIAEIIGKIHEPSEAERKRRNRSVFDIMDEMEEEHERYREFGDEEE
mgnify:CR=1 FL=1